MSSVFIFIISAFSHTHLSADSIMLSEVEITAPLKQHVGLLEQPVAATSISLLEIEDKRINEPKALSLMAPNLYFPD